MNKWISLIILLSALPNFISAQCTFESDFSSNNNWTSVGSGVSINNGALMFSSANSGEQRRTYRSLNAPLSNNDPWKVELDFTPTGVGTWAGEPAAGHYLFALTAGTQEPLSNCPNVACSGYPASLQDGVMIIFSNQNPPDGDINFQILHHQNGNELTSAKVPFVGLNTTYYLTFERLGTNDYQLGVFSNAARTSHIAGSPVALNVPTAITTGLNTIQFGAIARGDNQRELSGNIDDVCLRANLQEQVQVELPALPKARLLLFGFLMVGMIGFVLRKRF